MSPRTSRRAGRALAGVLALGLLGVDGAGSVCAQASPVAGAAQPQPQPQPQPPPRPSSDPAQPAASLLFQAIVHDDPALAEAFFFPRDAFVLVKAVPRPELYWDKLHKRFQADIHALFRATPDLRRASFVRLELTRRGGYVQAGEEGNKLPYWAARHAWLHYRVGDQPRKLEVRVLITWQDRWYVIHLNEFH